MKYLHLQWIKCINGVCQTIYNFFIFCLKCPWKINIKDMIFDILWIKKLINILKIFWYLLLTKNSIPYNKSATIIFVYAITVSAWKKKNKKYIS